MLLTSFVAVTEFNLWIRSPFPSVWKRWKVSKSGEPRKIPTGGFSVAVSWEA